MCMKIMDTPILIMGFFMEMEWARVDGGYVRTYFASFFAFVISSKCERFKNTIIWYSVLTYTTRHVIS